MTTETPQTPGQASGAPREGGAPAGGAPRPGGPGGFAPRGPRPGFGGGERRPFGPPGARRPRRKVCTFCLEKVKRIDYKETARLRRFLSDRGKIDPRRKSGSCAKHQRMLTAALKRARLMALLPYTAEHIRAMLSPQQRAAAGGPPPPKPERPPYRPPGPPMAPRPQPPQAAAPEQGSKTPAEANKTPAE